MFYPYLKKHCIFSLFSKNTRVFSINTLNINVNPFILSVITIIIIDNFNVVHIVWTKNLNFCSFYNQHSPEMRLYQWKYEENFINFPM